MIIESNNYWSSTTYESNPNNAWNVNMDNGNVNNDNKDNNNYVWPVRSDNDSLRLFSFETDLPFQNGPSSALNYWFFQDFYALRPVSF